MIHEELPSGFLFWNVHYSGAFYFYPADGGQVVASCEEDRYADWINNAYGARFVVDGAFLPRTLLDALADRYDPELPENAALANADGFPWRVDPEFDFYG